MRKVIVNGTFWIGATAMLAGAGVWETKPFMTWSDKELQQVLSDSPWSRTVQVVMNTFGRDGLGIESDGRVGGGVGEDEEGGGGGDGRGRGSSDEGFGLPPPQVKLLVTWRSALPMRQALIRTAYGLGGAITPEHQQELDHVEPEYVIRLGGLPVRYAGVVAAMQGAAVLKRGGSKPPIAASDMSAQQTETEIVVHFAFPRTDAIVVEDKEIEFVTKLGQFDVKKKFSLKEMVFKGKLEL